MTLRQHREVTDFIAYLRLKNLSPRTMEEYQKVLGSLFKYLQLGDSSPGEITTRQLRHYLANMQERGLAPKTVSNHVIVIKRFFGFLVAEGYIHEDPSLRIPNPKVGKRLPKALSIAQVQDLFAAFEDGTAAGHRDSVFFLLVYACGLRISEATHIKVEDIDFNEGTLRVIGKGDKERRVYLKPNLLHIVRRYVAERKLGTYLFPGRGGDKPITNRNMQDRFKAYVRAAGLPDRVTPHTLRHSVAVHYLINGAPITFVQRLLGHASLATTGIYTQLADTMTKEIALNTPIALDEMPLAEERALKERMAAYAVDFEEWDALAGELAK